VRTLAQRTIWRASSRSAGADVSDILCSLANAAKGLLPGGHARRRAATEIETLLTNYEDAPADDETETVGLCPR
jgi:hypothetical protein